MTTTFDSRGRGFENKYAHDQEVGFEIAARANYLLGLWVAEKMHLEGEEAEEYAQSLVGVGVQSDAAAKIKEKVLEDLRAVELEIKSEEVIAELQKFLELAEQEN